MLASYFMPQQALQPGTISDVTDERWKLVRDILASRSFAKASRLSSFLAYVCAETLRGNGADLNERQIGIEVFGRSASYLPAEDSIVRASARLLRNRLELYFSTEGKDSDWIIIIPKGSYIPVFKPRPRERSLPSPLAPIEVRVEEQEASESPGSRRFPIVIGILFVIAAILAVVLRLHPIRVGSSSNSDKQIWSMLLTPKRRTLIVPADSTLSLIQTERRVPLTLSEYLEQKQAVMTSLAASSRLPQALIHISDHQYTSIADLNMAFRIGRLPQADTAQLEIRYARDLTLSELKNSNLILMGGPRANPWVQLFAGRIDYSLDDEPADGLDNVNVKAPRPGEQSRYMAVVKGEGTYSLAVIAFVGGLEGDDHALLIEGTDMAGTEGACDFLLDSKASAAFFSTLTRPDGSVSHFELLLETKTVKGNASEPQILAYRRLP